MFRYQVSFHLTQVWLNLEPNLLSLGWTKFESLDEFYFQVKGLFLLANHFGSFSSHVCTNLSRTLPLGSHHHLLPWTSPSQGIDQDHLLSILFSLISSSPRTGCSHFWSWRTKDNNHWETSTMLDKVLDSLSYFIRISGSKEYLWALPCYIGYLTDNHCDFECFGGCLLVGAVTCWKFQHPFVTQEA